MCLSAGPGLAQGGPGGRTSAPVPHWHLSACVGERARLLSDSEDLTAGQGTQVQLSGLSLPLSFSHVSITHAGACTLGFNRAGARHRNSDGYTHRRTPRGVSTVERRHLRRGGGGVTASIKEHICLMGTRHKMPPKCHHLHSKDERRPG
ncbi:hypothetical protein AAFF_G00428150 [Aldrovandia affinis]|uniref:Uncharacterized protein n=1 Tax=Aldrovandia affinis TaxID=143900 RepID=A0AAD7S937_9TELE|nr:hypothetical protein AAFF_G00428150 [Aldrovandia affinis]